ncbi:hypothetical protein G6F57_017854 [Rhizopus arrhizus]|nr:hypothetical protein G6F57_017854 [Rhizopus arrhizus]
MERADDQALGQLAVHQGLHALVHLARGLVGEGQRHHVAAHVAALAQQVSDLLRDHARLAAAGAGQHEARAVQVKHRLFLGGIHALANRFACGHFELGRHASRSPQRGCGRQAQGRQPPVSGLVLREKMGTGAAADAGLPRQRDRGRRS